MKSLFFFFSALLFVILSTPINAQPGSLDETFGNGGIVTTELATTDESCYDAIIQPDGKILLAGFQDVGGSQNFAVARYNADGSLDNGFGNSGLALFEGGTDSDATWAMALQSDGKILLGGSVYNQFTTVDDYALVRLNTNGTADMTFGTGGMVTTDVDGFWDNAFAIAIQDDGKILLGGDGFSNNKRNACLVRYNTDGALDASFGTGGIVINSTCCGTDKTKTIAIQNDGKILAAGFNNEGIHDNTFISRFNTDGTLDNTFGNNGTTILDIGGNNDRFWDLGILPDGKIIAGGTTEASGELDYLLVRYLTDGTLDIDFGSNGIAMTNFTANDFLHDLVIDDNGKILTAGGGFSFELVRFLDTGYKDTEFGVDGIVNTNIGNFSISSAIGLQSDGKIIVAGQSNNGNDYDFALARYHAEAGSFIEEQHGIMDHVKVYPNPSVTGSNISFEYKLDSDQQISIELLSINGKLIETFKEKQNRKAGLHQENLILPGNLSAGIYFIRLTSAKESAVVRVEVN